MPDNVIKTDIQDYWRRSYVGGKEIPSSNVEQVKVYETSEYTSGETYHTEGAVGAVIGQVDASSPQFYCLKIEGIKEGDKLFVHGRSFTDRDLIAFADKDSKKISVFSQYGTAGDVYATAPKNANIAYLNSFKDADFSVTYTKVSSRLYAGDKEVDIMYAGDKVAYAKHKENLVGVVNATSRALFNTTNNSFKMEKENTTDHWAKFQLLEPLNIGESINVSFDVTDCNFVGTGREWVFPIFRGSSFVNKVFKINGVGHYESSDILKSNCPAGNYAMLDDTLSSIQDGDFIIVKNIKLERNIVDTGYSLAPSVTPQNRVKIGKHWYNTCTIGSQEWLSENLNEDLKDAVAKDVDWRCALQSGVILTNVDLGSTITLSRNSSADWYSCWFPVSEGETITYGGYGAYNASVVCLLDAENKLLWKSNSDIRDYNQTTVVPSGAVTCLFQSKESGENYGKPGQCIQSTHTSEGTWEGYYNNDPSYGVKGYGKLYTWDCLCSDNETPSAAMAALLKDGWRVPTKADFDSLVTTVGLANATKLREKWYWNTPGTNENGFSAIGSGFRTTEYQGLNIAFRSWSSTISTTTSINRYNLMLNESGMSVSQAGYIDARSVRLVRDVPVTLSAPPTTGSAYVASVDGNVGWVSE